MKSFKFSLLRCILLNGIAVFLNIAPVYADAGTKQFEEIKTRYLKLRNTDAETAKLIEWQQVGADLEDFAQRFASSKHAASALFDASIAQEKIFEVAHDEEVLARSLSDLELLVQRYPTNSLADDALLRQGDLYSLRYNDRAKAVRAYERILAEYPQSDMSAVAQVKLKRSQPLSSKNLLPSRDNEDKTKPLIMIDPGHGGEDLGAEGIGGLLEKDVALDISRELAQLIRFDGRARAQLTREGDEFVPLADRTALANQNNAAVFISIHSNASGQGKLSGFQTYYLDTEGDESSRLLAERENESASMQGAQGDLQFMLSDLVQNAKLDDSMRLGRILQSAVISATRGRWKSLKDLGTRKAPFYVLVGAHMPCVLLEVLFIDNPVDGRMLSDKEFRAAVAQGIFSGLTRFLENKGK